MRVAVTIPDGPMADALHDLAEKTERTSANLCRYAVRVMLNKHGYHLAPLAALQTSASANDGDSEEASP